MDGYELSGRFSYITNALKYCGPDDGHKDFHKYILSHDAVLKGGLRENIKKFEALYPYLKFIAEKTGKDYMDYDVVEAYWMGNELLDQFNCEDMKGLVRLLMKRGLPETLGKQLIDNMPTSAFPFHTFHVLYIGVGNVTGHVKSTVQNMDNCRISYGKISEIFGTQLIVDTDMLTTENDRVTLKRNETKTVVYIPELLQGIKINDYVALHWGFACKKLDEREIRNIEKYTTKAILSKNSVRR